MSGAIVLAVDGGNSKTDLALVRDDGAAARPRARAALLAAPPRARRGGRAAAAAARRGARDRRARPDTPIAIAEVFLAGVDFPAEEDELRRALEERSWADEIVVGNDTLALLRAGTERGWGVAVVCGAGINCVGVAPDGRELRFPALGAITGDWGGGYDVGLAALSAAARSEDGRGPKTSLERSVPAFFELDSPRSARRGDPRRPRSRAAA